MSACREAREVVQLNYVRLNRPHHGPNLLENPARILYANLDIDTVVIDITAPQTEESGSDILDRSLFDLPNMEFMTEIYTRFVGLSRVKHLALAFNVTHDNGGALFIALQAACPELRTLTVFPNSQMHVAEEQQDRLWGEDELHFVEVDSISQITNSFDMTYYQAGDTSKNPSEALTSFLNSKMSLGNIIQYSRNTSENTV